MDTSDYGRSSLFTKLYALTPTGKRQQQLMGLRCGGGNNDEEKWAAKAIESLVKKLNTDVLKKLLHALGNPGDAESSECVTMPRTCDGRMQIAHRKMTPHLMFCKIWRWADISSPHQIQAIDCCRFPFDAKTEEVCVNPYHYRTRDSPRIDDVRVYKNHDYHHHQQQQRKESCVNDDVCTLESIGSAAADAADTSYDAEGLLTRLDEAAQSYELTRSATVHYRPQYGQQTYYGETVNSEVIRYQEPSSWGTVAYYELNNRLGEQFHCRKTLVTVDGFTNPSQSGDRFCLGSISNVNRNSQIEAVRRAIGQGVTLHYAAGDLFAECTSDKPIFVQSRICNCQNNYEPVSVLKLEPGMTLKIFDTTLFGNILNRVIHQGFAATYELIKLCVVRVSFIKGWGANYHRGDVTETPCWIEISLNGPLKWLDNVLVGMGSPPDAINSVS